MIVWPRVVVTCVIVALPIMAGCSDAQPDSGPSTEPAVSQGETETPAVVAGDEGSGATHSGSGDFDTREYVGAWRNSEDEGVFPSFVLHEDGTALLENYAGVESDGVWTLEDQGVPYLRLESASGETWGSGVEWTADTEFTLEWVDGYFAKTD